MSQNQNNNQSVNLNPNQNDRSDNDKYTTFLSWIKDNDVMSLINDYESSDILDTLYLCWLGGYINGYRSGSVDMAKGLHSLSTLKDNDDDNE